MSTNFEQTIERLAIEAEIRDLAARFSGRMTMPAAVASV